MKKHEHDFKFMKSEPVKDDKCDGLIVAWMATVTCRKCGKTKEVIVEQGDNFLYSEDGHGNKIYPKDYGCDNG